MVILDKRTIRKKILLKRSQLSQGEISEKSKAIRNNLFDSDQYQKSKFIFTFISFKDEVDTHQLIKESIGRKKRIGVPITIAKPRQMFVSELMDFDKELEIGYYNILTPKEEFVRIVSPEIIDLILVPGVAFDKRGYRVGYGGGYYDRFFSSLDENVIKIALCYDMQIMDEVPTDSFDVPVDYIATESGIISCSHKND